MPAASFHYVSVDAMPSSLWIWPHIDPRKEWADSEDGSILVVPSTLDRFETLRRACGFALPINSGYRTPAHNARVSNKNSGLTGPHTKARACDIGLYGGRALIVVTVAAKLGYTGFGVQQDGPQATRYIHLDDLETSPAEPRPTVWSY